MKNIYKIFFCVFLSWTLVGVLSKVPFLLMYGSLLNDADAAERVAMMWHGLRLDIAIAGYLTLLPGLMLLVRLWYKGKGLRYVWNGYFIVTALLYSLAIISNLGLYGYWGFPLDSTPLMYLRTSPADAMASMTTWQLICAPVAVILLAAFIYYVFHQISKPESCNNRSAYRTPNSSLYTQRRFTCKVFFNSLILLVLTALLILPIRGGVGTGTNHTGSVYFSTNIRLNHAAVNPAFSFIESVLHQEEIGTKYRFMSDKEATTLFHKMTHTALRPSATAKRYNVILISLESFSDSIMHIPGVTPCLNKLADEGLHFHNFYANSFRTDRALVAIHSALPAQPTMSVMDMPRKSTSLPSIASSLAQKGYSTTFYYGGDINYSNMRSYFVGTGFQHIVSDVDFPKKLHTGKWGVADGPVFDRMLADIKSDRSGKPFYRSIMTESSHEPFDVPNYKKIKSSPELNAFAYADECLGMFMNQLAALPCWRNTLVVIVPDHLGAHPANADNYQQWRFRVPLILSGGAIEDFKADAQESLDVIGSQIDIAATVLALLGIDHSDFTYSKDLLDHIAPHFAFFTFPDAIGITTDSGRIIYDNTSNKVAQQTGTDSETLVKQAQAFLQKLYDDLDKR